VVDEPNEIDAQADKLHDWSSRFTGVDTRDTASSAGTSGDAPVAASATGGGAFSADAYYAQTLASDGYSIGTDAGMDQCYLAFAQCLKGLVPGDLPDDCVTQLRGCLSASRARAANSPPPADPPATPPDPVSSPTQTPQPPPETAPSSQQTAPASAAAGSSDPPPPPPPPPPDSSSAPSGVLRRDTDHKAFWRPNPAPPTWGTAPLQPAPDDWVSDFLAFYNLRPSGSGGAGACEFNSETTTVDAVAALVAQQAALANYSPPTGAKRIAIGILAGPPDVISGADPAATLDGKSAQVSVVPPPAASLNWDTFIGMLDASTAVQWNAWRSAGGPVPPPLQLNLNLTLSGYLKSSTYNNLKVSWVGDPTVTVVINSSGPVLSDQYAFNILKAHYDLPKLNMSVEGAVAGVAQGLLFGGPPQGGAQGTAVINLNKTFAAGITGTIMANKDGVNFAIGPILNVSF
jgi:hypothetical protein